MRGGVGGGYGGALARLHSGKPEGEVSCWTKRPRELRVGSWTLWTGGRRNVEVPTRTHPCE